MNQLRFDVGLGVYTVSAAPDSVMITKGMGTHYIRVQLQVGIPEVGTAAGRLLFLETTLYAPQGSTGGRAPLASANVSVPFNPSGEIRRPELLFLVTNAQVQALEQQRTGDLRLELEVNAVLPQASGKFPGTSPVTEYITIAESRWRQQLAGLGRTLGAEMLIAFPDDDEIRRAVGGLPARGPATARRPRDRRCDAPGPQGAGDHQEHRKLALAGRQEGQGRDHSR